MLNSFESAIVLSATPMLTVSEGDRNPATQLQIALLDGWATGLFFRLTLPGKLYGFMSLAFGTLDDQEGITMTKEWFIDRKPEAYELAGERQCVTETEAFAMLESVKD